MCRRTLRKAKISLAMTKKTVNTKNQQRMKRTKVSVYYYYCLFLIHATVAITYSC